MDLFIANCTKQKYDLHYRLPEVNGPRHQMALPGGQVKIAGDLSTPQIEALVKQLSHTVGMVHVDDINRVKPFVGLCYSDKKIKVDVIMRAFEHNDEVLTNRGQEIRRTVAVAMSDSLKRSLEDSQIPETLGELEVTASEIDRSGKPVDGGVREGIVVSKNAPRESMQVSKSQQKNKRKDRA